MLRCSLLSRSAILRPVLLLGRPSQQLRHSFRNRLSVVQSTEDAVQLEAPRGQALVDDALAFLKEDLKHLFDSQGIDTSRYDEKVDFEDPVTSHSTVQGYMFNIALLKRVFNPEFTLHDIKQTGEYELTSRWTMQMSFTPASSTPLKSIWNPQLTFTGVSIYGLNPENGKINKHIDLWDAVDDQQFPSLEGFIHVLRQLLSVTRTPDLETPNFTILKKTKAYEIRQYPPFLVAETQMQSSKGMTAYNPASRSGGSAFNELASYIFGQNSQKEKMEMTTPVFTDTTGNMQFVLGSKYKAASELPSPDSKGVDTKEITGGLFACSMFNGLADEGQTTNEHTRLEKTMIRDKLTPGKDWILARYNDPFTNPLFRRNEILIPIEDGFSLW